MPIIFGATIDGVRSARLVKAGKKTVTLRMLNDETRVRLDHRHPDQVTHVSKADGPIKWQVGVSYAVLPGRGKHAICRVVIESMTLTVAAVYNQAQLFEEGFGVAARRVAFGGSHLYDRWDRFKMTLEALYPDVKDIVHKPAISIKFHLDRKGK